MDVKQFFLNKERIIRSYVMQTNCLLRGMMVLKVRQTYHIQVVAQVELI
jgi:hypothetical protein